MKRNPYLTKQRDLFEKGETQGNFIPLEELDHDTLVTLKPHQFSVEEWDELEEEDRAAILANDPVQEQCVKEVYEVFESAINYALEGGYARYDPAEYAGESFDQWLAETDIYGLPNAVLDAIREAFPYADFHDPAIFDELRNAAHYRFELEDERYFYGSYAVYSERVGEYEVDIEASQLPGCADSLCPAARREAELRIDADYDEYDFFDRDSTRKWRAHSLDELLHGRTKDGWPKTIQLNIYTGKVVVVYSDTDAMIAAIRENLGEAEGRSPRPLPQPDESQIVYRWDDGYYIVELKRSDLAEESRTMKHCVVREDMGYGRGIDAGTLKIWSLRGPEGGLFTIELGLDERGNVVEVRQVKGRHNRYPGFAHEKEGSPYASFKKDEFDRAVFVVEEILGLKKETVRDFRYALERMKTGLAPKKHNPGREPRRSKEPYGFDAPTPYDPLRMRRR